MELVTIQNGSYNNQPIAGSFPLIKGLPPSTKGGYFITVDATKTHLRKSKIRIRVVDKSDVSGGGETIEIVEPTVTETEEEAMNRIAERFKILEDMTTAMIDGVVRGLVVSGPPGIGKSYGVEQVIKFDSLHDALLENKKRYAIVKGTISPISLYKLLYEHSDESCVIVLDDCDSVLFDPDSLNILKAALDSSVRREISWISESRALADVPSSFVFGGAVMFLTNLKFDKMRTSRIKDHVEAILSRCHYLDLSVNTTKDKVLRCKQVIRDGMLRRYGFDDDQEQEIVDYFVHNHEDLREVSLRMVTKIADIGEPCQTTGKGL